MLFAYTPVAPDVSMMAALLGSPQTPFRSTVEYKQTPSQSKVTRTHSRRRRLSNMFSRSPRSSSSTTTLNNIEASSEARSFRKTLARTVSSAASSTKTASTSPSSRSSKSLKSKDSTQSTKPSPSQRVDASTARNQAHASAWTYVIW